MGTTKKVLLHLILMGIIALLGTTMFCGAACIIHYILYGSMDLKPHLLQMYLISYALALFLTKPPVLFKHNTNINRSHYIKKPTMSDPEPQPEHDPVNHPEHYTSHPSGVECITIIEHMPFNTGNTVKYLWREGMKGSSLEDLKKARWYLDREISNREAETEQKDAPIGLNELKDLYDKNAKPAYKAEADPPKIIVWQDGGPKPVEPLTKDLDIEDEDPPEDPPKENVATGDPFPAHKWDDITGPYELRVDVDTAARRICANLKETVTIWMDTYHKYYVVVDPFQVPSDWSHMANVRYNPDGTTRITGINR